MVSLLVEIGQNGVLRTLSGRAGKVAAAEKLRRLFLLRALLQTFTDLPLQLACAGGDRLVGPQAYLKHQATVICRRFQDLDIVRRCQSGELLGVQGAQGGDLDATMSVATEEYAVAVGEMSIGESVGLGWHSVCSLTT